MILSADAYLKHYRSYVNAIVTAYSTCTRREDAQEKLKVARSTFTLALHIKSMTPDIKPPPPPAHVERVFRLLPQPIRNLVLALGELSTRKIKEHDAFADYTSKAFEVCVRSAFSVACDVFRVFDTRKERFMKKIQDTLGSRDQSVCVDAFSEWNEICGSLSKLPRECLKTNVLLSSISELKEKTEDVVTCLHLCSCLLQGIDMVQNQGQATSLQIVSNVDESIRKRLADARTFRNKIAAYSSSTSAANVSEVMNAIDSPVLPTYQQQHVQPPEKNDRNHEKLKELKHKALQAMKKLESCDNFLNEHRQQVEQHLFILNAVEATEFKEIAKKLIDVATRRLDHIFKTYQDNSDNAAKKYQESVVKVNEVEERIRKEIRELRGLSVMTSGLLGDDACVLAIDDTTRWRIENSTQDRISNARSLLLELHIKS